MDDWDINTATWAPIEKSITETESDTTKRNSSRRTTECFEMSTNHLYRRAFSESQLLDKLGLEDFKQGHSYHFLTGGNIDSLSFLKLVLRHHKLDYLMFSTWCMAAEDILQFREWLDEGFIDSLDAYVGEIFPRTYKVEWQMLNRLFSEKNCGKIVCFNNHSKIYAGYNDNEKFYFAIESSANINTNPRQENACIIIDRGLSEFYIDAFAKVKNNEKLNGSKR